jgi:protein tyrosine phosphatase
MRKPTKENDDLFKGLIEDALTRISKNELFFVHCMAGVGRTGTFGSVLEAVRCGRATGQVSIFEVVHCLRNMRLYSV